MKCPVCSQTEMKFAFPAEDFYSRDPFEIHSCSSCGLAITQPFPAQMERYYPAAYRQFAGPTKWLMRKLYEKTVRNWIRFVSQGASNSTVRSVLEIGVGTGWMLEEFRRNGWKVRGYERNPDFAGQVQAKIGIPVLHGDLTTLPEREPSERYDVILLFNVIEHLDNPVLSVRAASQLLKPGGYLIVNAPCFSSWQARFGGADWAHLDAPRHLFHFSADSLERLIQQEKLEARTIRFGSWVHDPYGWVVTWLNRLGFERNRLTRELMAPSLKGLINPSGIFMGAVGALLAPFAILTSVISWKVRQGGLIEIWAQKPLSPKPN